ADQQHISNVVVAEDVTNAAKFILAWHVARRAQRSAWGRAKSLDLRMGNRREIQKIILEQSLDAEACAEHLAEFPGSTRLVDHAKEAGIDHGRWSAALQNEQFSELRGHRTSPARPEDPVTRSMWRMSGLSRSFTACPTRQG